MNLKETINDYVQKKEVFKKELIKILSKINNDSHNNYESFVEFCINSNAVYHVNEWKPTSMEEQLILDILSDELDFPNNITNYTKAFAALYIKMGMIDSHDAENSNYEIPGFDSTYELLEYHDFECLGYTSSGDVIAINTQSKLPKICYFSHEATFTNSELLEEMYGECYSFYDNGDGTFENDNHLLIDKIYDSEGNFMDGSIYVKKMLNEDDEIEELDYSYPTFIAYLAYASQALYIDLFKSFS